jgi:FMN-dependent NADH-azoreductase
MKKILHIISSPRGEHSFSIKLGHGIVYKLLAANPDSTLKERNLTEIPFPHLGAPQLAAIFTREENRTAEHVANLQLSETAIEELFEADFIVIGAPVYNMNIHSSLKAWIDHIVRTGRTVNFGAGGAEGLLKNKKVYVAICSAGKYSDGDGKLFDFVSPFLRFVLNLIGLSDVEFLRVEGTAVPAEQSILLNQALTEFTVTAANALI